jgi:membrane protease YdiL (CAAX protease family)
MPEVSPTFAGPPSPGAPQPPEPSDAPFEARWPPWTAPLALVAGLIATFVGGGLLIAVAVGIGGGKLTNPPLGATLLATVFQDVALVGAAILFARHHDPALSPGRFGLRPVSLRRAAPLIVAVFVASYTFNGIWALALGSHQQENLHKQLGLGHDTLGIVATAVVVTAIAPVAEELFFRGYFFAALRRWRGPGPAAVLTGIAFGAVHGLGSTPVVYLVPLAFLGFLLCLLYQRTGSLFPGIAVHVVNNVLAFGIDEHWGWQIPVLLTGSAAFVALVLVPLARLGIRVASAAPAPA